MNTTAATTGETWRTIPHRIRTWADRQPDRVCLREKRFGIWQDITWREYWDNAQLVAHGLAALGVGAGDRVGIHSENRPEWLYTDVGCVAIRAISVGLYSTNPPAEVAYLLRDSGARVLIAEDQEQVDKALAVEDQCPDLEWIVYLEPRGVREYTNPKLLHWPDFIERGRAHQAEHPTLLDDATAAAGPDDVVTLIYTSGTTGPPKGAMLTVRNVSFATDVLGGGPGLYDPAPRESDVTLSYLPLCHVVERAATIWVNAAAGTTVHFAESIDTVVANLREVQPTLFFGVPRIWEKIHAGIQIRMSSASRVKRLAYRVGRALADRIADDIVRHEGRRSVRAKLLYALGYPLLFRALRDRIGLRKVRACGSGAAPIAPEVLRFFFGIGVVIREAYGMTENSAVATGNRGARVKLGTVGEAHEGTEVRLDDDTGEIMTRHPGNFAGYWNKPDKTVEVLDADGWLRTGDVGEWVDGTHLKIVDRIKDVIITAGGKNIAPSEIENALKTSPFIKEAVVVGDRQPYLTALIGIELETVGNWAQRRRLTYTTYRDLIEKREVLELIQGVIKQVNADFARVEQVRKFRTFPKELDHDDGELTATQKVKRATLHDRFGDLIDDMYGGTTKFAGGDLAQVHTPASSEVPA
ncbi:AMP-dependent synthetase/ligase [Phytoactinopolyspora limicola]|uniref:AMP-dependent synthetase/ligase n=1 Tax=Phytoactinopolyspora limicola TaxID=2715536 RepID=UPI00140B621B|nr:AMP-binding protein [Phytoactinopolyspora limicola]